MEFVQSVSVNASLHFARSAPAFFPVPSVQLRSTHPRLPPHLLIRFLSSRSPEVVVGAITPRRVPSTLMQFGYLIISKENRRYGNRDLLLFLSSVRDLGTSEVPSPDAMLR